MEGIAVVHHWRNVSTNRVDYWVEWDSTTFISLLPMANRGNEDVPQVVNHYTAFHDRYYIFLVFIDEK